MPAFAPLLADNRTSHASHFGAPIYEWAAYHSAHKKFKPTHEHFNYRDVGGRVVLRRRAEPQRNQIPSIEKWAIVIAVDGLLADQSLVLAYPVRTAGHHPRHCAAPAMASADRLW